MYNKRIELTEEDFYLNEQGYRVFTEEYHIKRGYCCKSGCKHCPYGSTKIQILLSNSSLVWYLYRCLLLRVTSNKLFLKKK